MSERDEVLSGQRRWWVEPGDCLDVLRRLPDGCVQCCVTSPPYFALRSYLPKDHPDKGKEIGSEPHPAAFVATMVAVFADVRRVLRDDGTLWLNLGDSYCANPAGNLKPRAEHGNGEGRFRLGGAKQAEALELGKGKLNTLNLPGTKPKDLLGIPWQVALALRDDGWYLRSEIIWHKPAPMPESVRDRPTKAHEQIFLLAKSQRYFYDAEAVKSPSKEPGRAVLLGDRSLSKRSGGNTGNAAADVAEITNPSSANLRSVWTLSPEPFPEAHFATFPSELPRRCILAGTSEWGCCPHCGAPWERVVERERNGDSWVNPKTEREILDGPIGGGVGKNRLGPRVADQSRTLAWQPSCPCPEHEPIPCLVLDPFAGAGTTLLVARRLQRRAIGIDLNPEYVEMARRRILSDSPLFNAPPELHEAAGSEPAGAAGEG